MVLKNVEFNLLVFGKINFLRAKLNGNIFTFLIRLERERERVRPPTWKMEENIKWQQKKTFSRSKIQR